VKKPALDKAPEHVRSFSGRGLAAAKEGEKRVDRKGGEFSAGIIRGVSVITRGEALGHDAWIDSTFLDSVAGAMAAKKSGIKSRFTHPGLSSDAMGSALGFLKDPRREGDQVFADLHFTEASHTSPRGDLGSYVMQLAEETPEEFGLSIVFDDDLEAESAHLNEHSEELTDTDPDTGRRRKLKRFKSPDPDNVKNLQHVRLSSLRAGDVVDTPAANAGGMFSEDRHDALIIEAERSMAYALGLEGATAPDGSAFSIHPERLKRFAERFLESRGLTIVKKDGAKMAEGKSPADGGEQNPPADVRAEFAANLDKFTKQFGAQLGSEYLAAGLTFEASLVKFAAHQGEKIAAEKKRADDAETKLSEVKIGESKPLPAGDGEKEAPKSFSSLIKVPTAKK